MTFATETNVKVLQSSASVCVCLSVRRAATKRASLSTEPRLQGRRISLRGEGHALYPVLSILAIVEMTRRDKEQQQIRITLKHISDICGFNSLKWRSHSISVLHFGHDRNL